MGCASSKLPDAATFLADAQPAPEVYLLDGVSPQIVMNAWSVGNFTQCHHIASSGSLLGTLNMLQDKQEDIEDWIDGEDWDVDFQGPVGDEGVGKPETLLIKDTAGKKVGTLTMPCHISFGKPAYLRDAGGNVIAMVMTASKTRPLGTRSTAVNVYATKPQFAGQASMNFGDSQGYLWASVMRKAFTNGVEVSNGKGEKTATGFRFRGSADKIKLETLDKKGLMLVGPTPTDKKKADLQCAQGVDVALSICIMAAIQIGRDEIFIEKDRENTSGGADFVDDME